MKGDYDNLWLLKLLHITAKIYRFFQFVFVLSPQTRNRFTKPQKLHPIKDWPQKSDILLSCGLGLFKQPSPGGLLVESSLAAAYAFRSRILTCLWVLSSKLERNKAFHHYSPTL